MTNQPGIRGLRVRIKWDPPVPSRGWIVKKASSSRSEQIETEQNPTDQTTMVALHPETQLILQQKLNESLLLTIWSFFPFTVLLLSPMNVFPFFTAIAIFCFSVWRSIAHACEHNHMRIFDGSHLRARFLTKNGNSDGYQLPKASILDRALSWNVRNCFFVVWNSAQSGRPLRHNGDKVSWQRRCRFFSWRNKQTKQKPRDDHNTCEPNEGTLNFWNLCHWKLRVAMIVNQNTERPCLCYILHLTSGIPKMQI